MPVLTSSLKKDFVVLDATKKATLEPCDGTLYQRLDRDYNGFSGCELISYHEFTTDWPSWEKHPHGDEIVILLSGHMTFVLESADGDREVELTTPGDYVVVPADVWHTARAHESSRMLFVTPGEGTEHRSV